MQKMPNISRCGSSLIRVAAVVAAVLLAGSRGYADILSTSATVRPTNSLLVDVQVTTSASVEHVSITYQTAGVNPLVSRFTQVSSTGSTTITIGRLRANRSYTYTVDGFDRDGSPAGTASGSFTTGPLPPALQSNTYTLTGRTTVPLVIVANAQPTFQGYVGLDLHSPDAPQIVWYYSNAPSNASGALKVDSIQTIVQEQDGNFLFADAGTGPPPLSADSFYREIAPDGTILAASPATCSVTPPKSSPASAGWIWGQGNDVHELLLPGADGVPGTILHLGKIAKDPFFDAGQAPQGARVQLGTSIRRWNLAAGTDEVVWDPFNFLDPRKDGCSDLGSGGQLQRPSLYPLRGSHAQDRGVDACEIPPDGAHGCAPHVGQAPGYGDRDLATVRPDRLAGRPLREQLYLSQS